MYIEIGNEGLSVNLMSLIGFRKMTLAKGFVFNGETLEADVFALEFITPSNQIAIKFQSQLEMEATYEKCRQLTQAWANSIMRAGVQTTVKPVMIPNIRGH